MLDVSYRAGFTDATRPVQGAERANTLLYRHEVPLPEGVKAAFEVANPFTRLCALLLDLLFVNLTLLALVWVIGMLGGAMVSAGVSPYLLGALFIFAFAAVNLGYFFVAEGFFSGQTPGKRIARLRVIKQDGEEVGPREGLIRAFIRLAIIGPMPGLVFLGVFSTQLLLMLAPLSVLGLWMFVDRKTRSIPDLVAGTLVVRQYLPEHIGNRPYVPPYFMLPTHYFPLNHNEMSKLTPEDYARLEEFGSRLATIRSSARQQAAMAAAAALARRMNYSHPVQPQYAELFLFEMHSALKQQLQQLYPDLYA